MAPCLTLEWAIIISRFGKKIAKNGFPFLIFRYQLNTIRGREARENRAQFPLL